MHRHDGTPAVGARVVVTCGEWRREMVALLDGGFTVLDAPMRPCTVAVRAADDPSASRQVDHVEAGEGRLSLILPAGLARVQAPPSPSTGPFTLTLADDVRQSTRRPVLGDLSVSGLGGWSSGGHQVGLPGTRGGYLGTSPTSQPDQWMFGLTGSRAGPLGTRVTGTTTARRLTAGSTLLSDVVGLPMAVGAGSTGVGGLSPALVWDARVGIEKRVTWRGVDITFFGEAYQSFSSATGEPAALGLPGDAASRLRVGSAAHGGVRIGF